MFMFYFIWIPILISSIFFMSWVSCKSDESWNWFWLLFASGSLLQMWPWVARYSNRIVFDAILYDSLAVITWTFSLMFFSDTRFSLPQWIGTALVVSGLFLIQKF